MWFELNGNKRALGRHQFRLLLSKFTNYKFKFPIEVFDGCMDHIPPLFLLPGAQIQRTEGD